MATPKKTAVNKKKLNKTSKTIIVTKSDVKPGTGYFQKKLEKANALLEKAVLLQ